MNAAAILAQQQQRSMKWATQPWQEQQQQIKTLAEIQAEEAEKQAILLRQQQQQQQEAMESAIRRPHSQAVLTPLSVIVAKGSSNQSIPPTSTQQTDTWVKQIPKRSTGGAWDTGIVADDESQNHQSQISSQQINYKAAVAAGQKPKIDSSTIRQVLKTIPKVKVCLLSTPFLLHFKN